MAVVRPTEIYLTSILGLKSAVEELKFRVFPGVYHRFTSEELSRCLKRDTEHHLGQRIGIADYRDIQYSFSKSHQDPEALPIILPDSADDVQRGHGSGLANNNYGLRSDQLRGVKPDVVTAFRRCSIWWHHITGKSIPSCIFRDAPERPGFLGIERLEVPPQTQTSCSCGKNPVVALTSTGTSDSWHAELIQKLDRMDANVQNVQSSVTDLEGACLAIQARRNPGATSSDQPERERFIPHPSLVRMLRKFLRNPSATFKIPEQAEALGVSIAGDRHLLVVASTGAGKSAIYMIPAAQRNHGITCVLLPLSALHLDFKRRCDAHNIPNSRWLPVTNEQPRTRIVYVSPEHAVTLPFINYLMGLSHTGELVQVVIDEVHLLHSHSDFRFCFAAMKPLLLSGKFFYLSMTSIGTI